VIPAGVICRHDCLKRRTFPTNSFFLKHSQPVAGAQGDISRKVQRNIEYIANLIALQQWYSHVRQNFFKKTTGALSRSNKNNRPGYLGKDKPSPHLRGKTQRGRCGKKKKCPFRIPQYSKTFYQSLAPCRRFSFELSCGKNWTKDRDTFLNTISGLSTQKVSYLEAIRMLTTQQTQTGTRWLKAITHHITLTSLSRLGLFRQTKNDGDQNFIKKIKKQEFFPVL